MTWTDTILISTTSFAKDSLNALQKETDVGFNVMLNPYNRRLSTLELSELIDKFKPVGLLAGTETIDRITLEKAKGYLRVISRVGVGWDNIDRVAAHEFRITVFRTENVLEQSVAELTIGLILSVLRNIPMQNQQIREGIWQKNMGGLLQGKIVGIIGFGTIGRRVGELVSAFNAKVFFYDPIPKEVSWAKSVDLSELLENSDIITIHASGTDLILGEREINDFCKKNVIIVNTARGGLIDEKALCKALKSGRVGYACLDVFESEPYSGPLAELENAILTPHIGSYAREARMDMEKAAVKNLLKGLKDL